MSTHRYSAADMAQYSLNQPLPTEVFEGASAVCPGEKYEPTATEVTMPALLTKMRPAWLA
jgi:hypothetical protein